MHNLQAGKDRLHGVLLIFEEEVATIPIWGTHKD